MSSEQKNRFLKQLNDSIAMHESVLRDLRDAKYNLLSEYDKVKLTGRN